MGRKVLKQRKHAVFAAVITAGLIGIGAVPAVAAASPAPSGTSETTSTNAFTGAEHCWFNAVTSASACYETEAALDTALEQLGVDQLAGTVEQTVTEQLAEPAAITQTIESAATTQTIEPAMATQVVEPAVATQQTVEPAPATPMTAEPAMAAPATAEPAMATQPTVEPVPVTEEAPPSSLVTAGIVYANAGYSGASYRILNYGGCSAGGSAFINLADVGWNDRVTSFRGYNGCNVRLHEDRDGEGAIYGDYQFSSWIGAFNDEASSASFFG